jgi:hypothetical protein
MEIKEDRNRGNQTYISCRAPVPCSRDSGAGGSIQSKSTKFGTPMAFSPRMVDWRSLKMIAGFADRRMPFSYMSFVYKR